MFSEELLTTLHKLSRTEKLRIVQILVNDLASEETTQIQPDREYAIWSPYDAHEAAQQLMALLEKDKEEAARNA
jgi:hypothetical protein